MNLKLRLLSNWLPKFVLIKELQKTSDITNDYLDKLLMKYCITPPVMENHGKVNLEKLRTLMATGHNQKVKALVELLGREKAVEVGRAQMFKAGYKMGCEARECLGVGENIEDAIAAAHLLYKVLGIKFHVENSGKDIILRVNSCALAVQYTPETCEVMSAADKGVLKGLNSNMDLEFIERITEGAEECKACINIKK